MNFLSFIFMDTISGGQKMSEKEEKVLSIAEVFDNNRNRKFQKANLLVTAKYSNTDFHIEKILNYSMYCIQNKEAFL